MMSAPHFDDQPPWFHLTQGSTPRIEEQLLGLQGLGVDVRRIRGESARLKGTLFSEVGDALQFPDYFASNWDSFDECLGDLDWLHHAALRVAVVFQADHVLAGEPGTELTTFVDIVDGATVALAEAGRPTHFLFQVSEPSRFRRALGAIAHRVLVGD